MKQYKTYKDSGVDWMSEVPEDWIITTLKRLADVKDGTHDTPKYLEKGIPFITTKDIKPDGVSFDNCKYISHDDYKAINKRSDVLKGDIIMPMIGSIGSPIIVKTNKVFSIKNLALIKQNSKSDLRFICYYLDSSATKFQFGLSTSGGVQDFISLGVLRNLGIPLLPLEEQIQIVNYLDHKTKQLDKLIAKKEQLVQLLQDERSTMINQAVTKGLDPNTSMKNSGIEWLGEIPKHWKVTRLKRIIDEIFLGLTAKVDYVENKEDGVPLIRAGNLFGGKLDLSDMRYISHVQHEKLTKYRKVQKGDVLVTKSGSIGVCAILNKDGEYSLYESVFAIRPSVRKLSNKYLLLLLNSHFLKQQYTAGMVGMGVHHLNMSDMKNTVIPLPNIEEQEKILSTINDRLEYINTIHDKTIKKIVLLKEYKTALISEVVTGKIDVREEVLN